MKYKLQLIARTVLCGMMDHILGLTVLYSDRINQQVCVCVCVCLWLCVHIMTLNLHLL